MRMMVMALATLALAGCGPDLGTLEKGETGKAAEIRDGDTFVMADGLVVHLAGIEAPHGDEPTAKDARAALERFVAHRQVQLAYGGQKRFREAAIAHVYAKTEGGRWVWVQKAMLLSGAARVHTRRENTARLPEMREAEAAARTARRGLWATDVFAIRKAESLARSAEETAALPECVAEAAALEAARAAREKAGPALQPVADETGPATPAAGPQRPRRLRDFLVVDGVVADVAERDRAVFLNFGDDITRDFGAMVRTDALDAWPDGAAALTALKGQRVRLRGEVPRCGKPLMRLDHAAQIEILAP